MRREGKKGQVEAAPVVAAAGISGKAIAAIVIVIAVVGGVAAGYYFGAFDKLMSATGGNKESPPLGAVPNSGNEATPPGAQASGAAKFKLTEIKSWDLGGGATFAWSPDSTKIVTGTFSNGDIQIWDAATGTELKKMKQYDSEHVEHQTTAYIWGVDWSPDGKKLAVAGNYLVYIWDVQTSTQVSVLNGPADSGSTTSTTAVAWNPVNSDRLASATWNRMAVWDVPGNNILAKISEDGGGDKAFAWSPDGSMIARGLRSANIESPDNYEHTLTWNVEILDASTLTLSRKLTARITFMGEAVSCLAWSPDGSKLASGNQMGYYPSAIAIWDMSTGKVLHELSADTKRDIGSVSWSPDGTKLAAVMDDALRVWDTSDWTEIARLNETEVRTAKWSPDGKKLAMVRDTTLYVYNAQ
ncbi:MAG: hypothetical protein V1839_02810 [archaeon]